MNDFLVNNYIDIFKYFHYFIFILLIKSQFNIDEKVLFSEIEKLDIRDEYKEFFDIYSLGKEKIELFQDL